MVTGIPTGDGSVIDPSDGDDSDGGGDNDTGGDSGSSSGSLSGSSDIGGLFGDPSGDADSDTSDDGNNSTGPGAGGTGIPGAPSDQQPDTGQIGGGEDGGIPEFFDGPAGGSGGDDGGSGGGNAGQGGGDPNPDPGSSTDIGIDEPDLDNQDIKTIIVRDPETGDRTSAQVPAGFESGDAVIVDGQVITRPDGSRESLAFEEESFREQVTSGLESSVEKQVGVGVEAGEDFTIRREGGSFVAEPTGTLEERILARERGGIEGLFGDPAGLDEGQAEQRRASVRGDIGGLLGDPAGESPGRANARQAAIERALSGIGANRSDLSPADAAAGVEQRLEAQLEQRLAEQGIQEEVDLREGEDFVLNVDRQRGTVRTTAELTPRFEQQLNERLFETQLARELNVPLEAGEDFDIVETEEGGFEAKLTERGAARVATQPLTETVSDVEQRLGIDIPGEGPILTKIDQDRDLGNIEIPVRMGPEDEFTTFDAALDELEQQIVSATADQGAPVKFIDERPGRSGAGIRTEQRSFTGEGRTPVAQFSESALRSIPLFATGAVGLTKDVAEFNVEAVEAGVTGDFERLEELGGDAKGAVTEAAVLTAATAADDPGEFAARGLGTLAGSAVLFGGARAVGPKTSLATRAAVQPGEEIAGFGGHAVTRKIAGARTAERLFPNKEPLIFSEEAAIRNIARASRGIQEKAAAARAAAATETTATRFRAAELDPRTDVDPRPLIQNIRKRLAQERKSLEFRIAEMDPRNDPRFPDTGEVEFVEEGAPAGVGAVPRLEARSETETLQDFETETEGGFATRLETRQQVEQPELEGSTESTVGGRRVETAFDEEDILAGVESRAIAAEVSELSQRGLLEPTDEQIGDIDLDQELDQELERVLESEFETETEGESELEAELEQELIQEAEAETEQELEFEIETEQESEQEVEAEGDFDPSRFEEELLGVKDPFADDVFESGIADVEAAQDIEERILGMSEGSGPSRRSPEDIEREILDG